MAQAQNQLNGILSGMGENVSRSGKRTIAKAYTSTIGANSRGENGLTVHVFNFDNGQGYAIMSGDQRTAPLIALTDSGTITNLDDFENPGMREFMAGLKDDIAEDSITWDPTVDSVRYVYGQWKIYQKEGNYCPVKWGQRSPYNLKCPVIDGVHALTGCAATAMAQYLAIQKYPASYSNFAYDWDIMTQDKKLTSGSNETAVDMVSQLMADLGKSGNLYMNYGTTASGAFFDYYGPSTLEHFGFSNGGNVIDYSALEVSKELAKNKGVLISGSDPENGGHAWLIHGYMVLRREVEVYVKGKKKWTMIEHEYCNQMNWGWNGVDDGYFIDGNFEASNYDYDDNGIKRLRADRIGYNFYSNTTIFVGVEK